MRSSLGTAVVQAEWTVADELRVQKLAQRAARARFDRSLESLVLSCGGRGVSGYDHDQRYIPIDLSMRAFEARIVRQLCWKLLRRRTRVFWQDLGPNFNCNTYHEALVSAKVARPCRPSFMSTPSLVSSG